MPAPARAARRLRVRARQPRSFAFMPGAPVALDQRDGRRRPPRAGGVGPHILRRLRPCSKDRVDPAPGRLDLVAAHEQGLVAADDVHHETFRSEEHTSELQSRENLVCRLLLDKKNIKTTKSASQ